MDQNGPLWPEEVHFGPFRSANRTLAIPDILDGQWIFNENDVMKFP